MNPAYNSALRMLARRDHVSGELRRKLKQKKYSDEQIQSAIERLIDLGYLKDGVVTKRRLQALVNKGFSVSFAIEKLVTLGFDRKLLQAAAKLESNRYDESDPSEESYEVENQDLENLEAIFKKKLNGKNDEKSVARAVRYLMSKGQSFTTVQNIFNKIQKPLGLRWPYSNFQKSRKNKKE
jgi:SOS response regulatory protein OraA/RecX